MVISSPLPVLIRLCGALALVAIGAGLGMRFLAPPDASGGPAVTCRPSDPVRALSGVSGPVVLFWGNSLLFDHSWDDSGFAAVNCARQGQTLHAALQVTDALPAIRPDAIVLAFGSVELIRPQPIDMQDWRADMASLIDSLRQRYPGAQLLVSGIPAGADAARPWHYGGRDELAQMNSVLSNLLDTDFLDLSATLDAAGLTEQHYDGVHLGRGAYQVWETMIARRLDR